MSINVVMRVKEPDWERFHRAWVDLDSAGEPEGRVSWDDTVCVDSGAGS